MVTGVTSPPAKGTRSRARQPSRNLHFAPCAGKLACTVQGREAGLIPMPDGVGVTPAFQSITTALGAWSRATRTWTPGGNARLSGTEPRWWKPTLRVAGNPRDVCVTWRQRKQEKGLRRADEGSPSGGPGEVAVRLDDQAGAHSWELNHVIAPLVEGEKVRWRKPESLLQGGNWR